MEVEEEVRLYLVWQALNELARESAIWSRNLSVFDKSSLEKKHAWWLNAQRMSDELPMYRTLVAKVIQLRMS